MEVTGSSREILRQLFLCNRGIPLIDMDEVYKQMGSNAYKDEKA